jgi:hypothetical protein
MLRIGKVEASDPTLPVLSRITVGPPNTRCGVGAPLGTVDFRWTVAPVGSLPVFSRLQQEISCGDEAIKIAHSYPGPDILNRKAAADLTRSATQMLIEEMDDYGIGGHRFR